MAALSWLAFAPGYQTTRERPDATPVDVIRAYELARGQAAPELDNLPEEIEHRLGRSLDDEQLRLRSDRSAARLCVQLGMDTQYEVDIVVDGFGSPSAWLRHP